MNFSKDIKGFSRYLMLIITPIIYWSCYHYIGIPSTLVKFTAFAFNCFLILYLFQFVFLKKYSYSSYSFLLKAIIVLMMLSLLTPSLFWGQSLLLTYRVSAWNFVFLYYFLLLKLRVSSEEINKLLFLFFGIYIFLWIIARINAPTPIFSEDEEISNARGTFRIIIDSFDIVCLLYFYSLTRIWKSHNKTSISKSRINVKMFIITLLSFFFIISNITRTVLVMIMTLTLVFLFSHITLLKKIGILLTVVILYHLLSVKVSDYIERNAILSSIVELTKYQLSNPTIENSSLRLIEYKIGFMDYPQNLITFLIGNGLPHPYSEYGKYEQSLIDKFKFNRSDAGYPAIFVTYGIIGLILFVSLFVKVFRQRTSKNFISYKYYVILIASINFLQDATTWYAVATSMAIYMLEMDRKQRKMGVLFSYSNPKN